MTNKPPEQPQAPTPFQLLAQCVDTLIRVPLRRMAKTRHVVLMMAPPEGAKPGAAPAPMGRQKDVRAVLARFNTAVDGGKGSAGIDRLYGPGFIVEIPTSVDDLTQIMAHIDDEETAWPVLRRMCKEAGWSMSDIESGQRFL